MFILFSGVQGNTDIQRMPLYVHIRTRDVDVSSVGKSLIAVPVKFIFYSDDFEFKLYAEINIIL